MTTYLPDVAQAVALVSLAWLLHRWDRHMAHLAGQLKVAGGRDLWRVRCAHCNHPLRDGDTVTRTVVRQYPTGTQTTTRTWHDDRPACAAAAWADEEPAEAAP